MFFTRAIVAAAIEAGCIGFVERCGLASQWGRSADKRYMPSHLPELTLNPEGGDPGG
jgi:hypothetical protein